MAMSGGEDADADDLALLVSDPVCGRDVAIMRAAASSDYSGATFYFCSLACQQDFDRQPDRYVEQPLHAEPPQT
jgi:YHS domain-containing protein